MAKKTNNFILQFNDIVFIDEGERGSYFRIDTVNILNHEGKFMRRAVLNKELVKELRNRGYVIIKDVRILLEQIVRDNEFAKELVRELDLRAK